MFHGLGKTSLNYFQNLSKNLSKLAVCYRCAQYTVRVPSKFKISQFSFEKRCLIPTLPLPLTQLGPEAYAKVFIDFLKFLFLFRSFFSFLSISAL